MDDFVDNITALATEYLGYAPKSLVVNNSIEVFRTIRNYPDTFTEDMILSDMQKNKSKIAMAVVELDAKEGAEGETVHSENGISRTYNNLICPLAYACVSSYVNVI